jgi:RND superfamily putative drug exporter
VTAFGTVSVVRCLLVPSVMVLMGKVNWWMPRWLDRVLPHVSIEGAEFFGATDGKAERPVAPATSQ